MSALDLAAQLDERVLLLPKDPDELDKLATICEKEKRKAKLFQIKSGNLVMGLCTAGKFGPDAKAAAHVLRYLAAAAHTKPDIADPSRRWNLPR